ncbi:iron uptake porin, partial [Klebsiella pneumoniae]|nr:iron uptake porin [Klebsiella pneumoniae]
PDGITSGQITSVNELSDVKPTDWAYQALQSLVERYGCIVGYPDRTFRGARPLSRYEFAAGLNACLDKVIEFAASKEDLD